MRVAAIQMVSGTEVGPNLDQAGRLVGEAAARGARLVVLPENFAIMPAREGERTQAAEADGHGPIQTFLAQTAQQHGLWLVGGTLPLRSAQPGKVRAACMVFDDQGQRVARYDKMHLFDVTLENGERHHESRAFEPGERPVTVEIPFEGLERRQSPRTGSRPLGARNRAVSRMGLAICYDLRFPELFRRMLDQGAELFVLPSAFTALTGKAHWETLVRARAIENLAYVIAAAQGGGHANGRETHGDSMIVSPWGEVMNRLARGPGVVLADLDRERLQQTRAQLPSIHHRRI